MTGDKEPVYMGESHAGGCGEIHFQEEKTMIIVGIDVASEKHDCFMLQKETGLVFRASSVTIGTRTYSPSVELQVIQTYV